MHDRYLKNIFSVFIIFIVLLFISCKSKNSIADETGQILKPVGLVLEKKIEGIILGEKINRPTGLDSDNTGDVYFIDGGNDRIVCLDQQYQAVREAGGFGGVEGLLYGAVYLTIDNSLNVIVSDAGNQRLSVYNSRLNFAYSIELTDIDDPLKYGRPAGILATDFGELWITDPDNSRLTIFNHLNQFDRFIGTEDSYANLFRRPTAICKGKGTNIVVADSENGKIFVFDNSGILRNEFGDDYLYRPTGIACDNKNRIWVVDSEFPGIFCFSYDGQMLFSEGQQGADSDYSFNTPTDITILPEDKIMISDTGNDRLLVYKILYL
ncbi:MAG: NHL repeat-containing protein [Candidatus Zixiibacteriota bacterium]